MNDDLTVATAPVPQESRLLGVCLSSVALLLPGCSVASTPTTSSAYQSAPTVPELLPVNTTQSTTASKLIGALSRGGSGTAQEFVSRTVRFNYNGVMSALEGCRLTTAWYSGGSDSLLSGEMTCQDGDLVAVDVTFDANNRITKVLGQGAHRIFDSTASTNRQY